MACRNEMTFGVGRILTDPQNQWGDVKSAARGRIRVAFRGIDVDWEKYNTKDYLFTHCTAVCSVETEENGYWIKPACEELVNANGNAWTNVVLMNSFKTFIGAENYLEHRQDPVLSKGKILDAILRPVKHHSEKYNQDANVYFCDILVATARIHEDLVERIESGELTGLSMGCVANVVTCSICGKQIKDDDRDCEHLSRHLGKMVECSDGKERICAELCFPSGTRVVTKNGIRKNIEEIQIGDEVITHTGNIKSVTNVFERNYTGELINLNIQGLPEIIKSTPNHPYLVIEQHYQCACGCGKKINTIERPTNKRNYLIKYAQQHRPENYVEHAELVWKEAKDINPYDIVVSPKLNTRNISENVELAYLLGWFVAEGNYLKKGNKRVGIRLTLNYNDELEKAYELAMLLNKNFIHQKHNNKEVLAHIKTHERKEGGYKLMIDYHNVACADWIYKRCGEYAGEKCLSEEVMNWDEEALSAFLLAYWEGDGTVDKFGRYKVSTISENLASQIQLIATKLSVWNCRQVVFNQKNISISTALKSDRDSMNFRPRYEISMYGYNTADILFGSDIKRNKIEKWRFEDNYALYKVVSKDTEKFCGRVYNIEVEDEHSYLVEGIAVHNCGAVDEKGEYVPDSVVFIEESWVTNPAFPGAVINSFVETEEERELRVSKRDELKQLFDGNLFERLRVADHESQIALKIAKEISREDGIAKKLFESL